jgi:hypothetical protein
MSRKLLCCSLLLLVGSGDTVSAPLPERARQPVVKAKKPKPEKPVHLMTLLAIEREIGLKRVALKKCIGLLRHSRYSQPSKRQPILVEMARIQERMRVLKEARKQRLGDF